MGILTDLIDQYYSDKSRDREQVKFYITDAGKCNRQVFFKFKQAPREAMEGRILRIFEHGEYIHQLIMKALFGIWDIKVIASEINMPPRQMISGRADAILSINSELYVLDIKSMNSMVFRNLTAPKEENLYQLQLYLHYFNVKKGILLYVDKDRQELKDFIVEYDIELCQELINGFNELKQKIDSDTVPVTLPDYPKNWQCDYCAFRAICDMAGKQELSWLDFKQKIQEQEK